ncbi:MAG: UvrD-helicase domain-containing protein [Spirochaetales bacterium]|nr:UvrD-helicase domain-containing protein [Spirochaetales bacterium]
MASLEAGLNAQQLDAVRSVEGPLLILAGAGSGKTRVITCRIAYLLEQGVPESAILAVTFTNKAAREMSNRVRTLCGRQFSGLTVCTFHAFGVKTLRQFGTRVGLRGNFTIYDESDRQSLLKEAARELGLLPGADGGSGLDLARVSALISRIKGRMEEPGALNALSPGLESLYGEYQQALRLHNAVDFDDLILLPVELLEEHPDALAALHQRYRYFMVDEFQDTSQLQYHLMRLLAGASKNLCVVGDDDQSIYSWRGAHFQNLMEFETDFPSVREIKLEQNYRSTRAILAVANGLIRNNRNRKGKKLWSGLPEGEPVEVFFPENEELEGQLIAQRIRALALERRSRLASFGVLVRTNGLTRAIEEAFLRENLLYQVSGGMSFFQRREVKDILGYLKLLANPEDDVNFLRIVNTPRRGLGKKSLETIVHTARTRSCSLYSALAALAAEGPPAGAGALEPPGAPAEKLLGVMGELVELLEEFQERFRRLRGMAAALRELIARIDYWGYLVQEHPRSAVARWKYSNVEGLVDSVAAYEEDPDVIDPSLFGYLSRISLITQDQDQDVDGQDKVNLLTIHAAKGLEFDTVFVPGLEAGVLPHARSLEESGGELEEERRLFYVAITRARRRLVLSACRSRRRRGQVCDAEPSPFLDELPQELLSIQEAERELAPEEAGQYFQELKRRLSGTSQ